MPPLERRMERCGLGGMGLRAAKLICVMGGGGSGAGCFATAFDDAVVLTVVTGEEKRTD